MNKRQYEQTKEQDQRQHEQQIELSSRQWRREKAFELLVALNEQKQTIIDILVARRTAFRITGQWLVEINEETSKQARKLIVDSSFCESLIWIIADETLAEEAREPLIAMGDIAHAKSPEEAESLEDDAFYRAIAVQERIGDYARAL